MLRNEQYIAARSRCTNDIAVLFWTGGTAARNPATSCSGHTHAHTRAREHTPTHPPTHPHTHTHIHTHSYLRTCMYIWRIYSAVNSKYVREVHSDELSRWTQFCRRFLFVRATKPTWLGKRREFRPYTKYFHIPFATAAPFSSSLSLSLLSYFYSLLSVALSSSSLSPYSRYQRVLGFIRRNENFALPPFPQREEEKQFKFRSFIKRNVSLSFSLLLRLAIFIPVGPLLSPPLLLSFLSPRSSCPPLFLPPSLFWNAAFGTHKEWKCAKRPKSVLREKEDGVAIGGGGEEIVLPRHTWKQVHHC